MIFSSAFTIIEIFLLILITVNKVNCNLNLNFDGLSDTAIFLDIGHTNHSKEFLLNSQANTRFFAVLEPNKPISLKSSFGPISVRETIYPSTIQDALLSSRIDSRKTHRSEQIHFDEDENSVLPANNEDVTAHLVSNIVYRNSPQLKILFHYTNSLTSHSTNSKKQIEKPSIKLNSTNSEHQLCAVAIIKLNTLSNSKNPNKIENSKPLIVSCSLSNNKGVCLAKATIPSNWWPSVVLDAENKEQENGSFQFYKKNQYKKEDKSNNAEVLFTSVYSLKCGETEKIAKINDKSAEHPIDKDAMLNLNWHHKSLNLDNVGKLTLKPFEGKYEELTNDDIIRILIPQQPIYAKNRLYVPVCYKYHHNYPLFAFALRIRVKAGLKILGVKLAQKTNLVSKIEPLTKFTKPSKQKKNKLLNEYNKLNSIQNWDISFDSNNKQTQATITSFLKLDNKDQVVEEKKNSETDDDEIDDDELDDDLEEFDKDLMNLMPSTCNEVYSILLEVDEKAIEFNDAGRIVWQLLYLTDLENSDQEKINEKKLHHHLKRNFDRESSKLTCKLDIQKDETESVIGITKNRNLLNTAILTGKQNMQALKIYAVSYAGNFDDVTLKSSCASNDESIIKVSPSCTALYLDGSENRSSLNASILIRYGTTTGLASYQVWMPKLPLELDVSDDKLNAIRSWKITHLKHSSKYMSVNNNNNYKYKKNYLQHLHHSSNYLVNDHHLNQKLHHTHHKHDKKIDGPLAEMGCRIRYQQAYIKAYTKFYIKDDNSAREWLLINRKFSFEVTNMILPHLHLSDNRLAILRSNIIEGLNSGHVELIITSPITGQKIASKKIEVSSEQEYIKNLNIRLITGLQMQIKPEHTILDQNTFGHNSISQLSLPRATVWSVKTVENSALTTQYQEGLLDIELQFSDGNLVSLSDITDSDYHLHIDSGNSGMIAFANGLSPSLLRIIALKNGKNVKLDVTLQTPSHCSSNKNFSSLSKYSVFLNVEFKNHLNNNTQKENNKNIDVNSKDSVHVKDHKVDSANHLQNDGHVENLPMVPSSQVQQFHSLYNSQLMVSQRNKLISPINQENYRSNWTGVEIGVYTILCVLGLLMTAFTTGCFVFAFKQKNILNSSNFATVTTVKTNDVNQDQNFSNNEEESNTIRLNQVFQDWFYTNTNKNSKNLECAEEDNQLSFDANGNPIIQSRVNLHSNPFEFQEDNKKNKNRESIISYPGSEISVQITANPFTSALESVISRCTNEEIFKNKKNKKNIEPPTPEPNFEEIKEMLENCKPLEPSPLQINKISKHRPPPPPIRPRKSQLNANTNFMKVKKSINKQNPPHIPGIACRTLNGSNASSLNSNSNHSSPDHSLDSNTDSLSSKISLKSSPSNSMNKLNKQKNIQNKKDYTENQLNFITNPFLNYCENQEEFEQFSNETSIISNSSSEEIPSEFYYQNTDVIENQIINDNGNIYSNITGPIIPKHQSSKRQRTRVIPPKSLFEDMNYNEIVNFIENMEESSA